MVVPALTDYLGRFPRLEPTALAWICFEVNLSRQTRTLCLNSSGRREATRDGAPPIDLIDGRLAFNVNPPPMLMMTPLSARPTIAPRKSRTESGPMLPLYLLL